MSKFAMPVDANGNALPFMPSSRPLSVTYDATISTSTEITLNADASIIEVTTIDKGVFMKWGTADVTSSDFDEYIAANTTRFYLVPVDTSTGASYTAANFIEEAATAKLVVLQR